VGQWILYSHQDELVELTRLGRVKARPAPLILWDVVSLARKKKFIVWGCRECSLAVPSASRAKSRFDTFCPRCNTRNTIYWGPGRKTMFDGRGAPRKVRFKEFRTYQEAMQSALLANWGDQYIKHQTSLFRDRVPGGFRTASTLPDFLDRLAQEQRLKQLREQTSTDDEPEKE